MQYSKELHTIIEALSPSFGEREARAVARIIAEDVPKDDWQTVVSRLRAGEPLQYIIGKADFYGLSFYINNSVLIPRPETEELVEWVLENHKNQVKTKKRLLDIGTGSGCIAIALAKKCPDWEVWAIDVSENTLEVARKNALEHGVDVHFLQLDVLKTVYQNTLPIFDIICSNPPYIPQAEKAIMPAQVIDNEPHIALFVEDEMPLKFYEAIADFATHALHRSEGELYVEINEHYGEQTLALLQQHGIFKSVSLRQDLSGKDRMIWCQI